MKIRVVWQSLVERIESLGGGVVEIETVEPAVLGGAGSSKRDCFVEERSQSR